MTTTPTILALDASSTMIGWVLYDGAVRGHGEIALPGADIAERCLRAQQALSDLLEQHVLHQIDLIAIEAPASPHKSSLIPQCRVSGALLACASAAALLVVEIAPQHAKQALAGKGNASKAEMMDAALAYGITGEHASDSLGVALAAVKLVSVEERQAA